MTTQDVQVMAAIQSKLSSEDAALVLKRLQADLLERIMRMNTEVHAHMANLLAIDPAGSGLLNAGAREELNTVVARLVEAGEAFDRAKAWILEGLQEP